MSDSSSLHTFKAHATTAVAAGGAVYAADQLVKTLDPDDHSTTAHLVKASVGAAVAVGALEMLNNEENSLPTYRRLFKRKYSHHHSTAGRSASHAEMIQDSRAEEVSERRLVRKEQSASSSSRSSSISSSESGHKRRLAEELVAAYSVGKQLLGDKKHRIAHLVADAVGAAALLKEVNLHDLRNK